jgi:hypothetical protein
MDWHYLLWRAFGMVALIVLWFGLKSLRVGSRDEVSRLAELAGVLASHKIWLSAGQGLRGSIPNVVWREDLGTWSHWKPGLRVTKKET